MDNSNSDLILSISSMMISLMKATGIYVHRHLEGKSVKIAYKKAMTECIAHVDAGWLDIKIMKTKIEGVKSEVNTLYKDRLFSSKKEERQGHLLAVEHALDIVNSLEIRFITGSSGTGIRKPHFDGDTYFEDKSLF